MKRVLTLIFLLITIFLIVSNVFGQEFDKNIVGYYTSWSIYARDYHVPDIPADKINYINYAFANISNGEIVLGDYYADVDRFYPGDSWEPGTLRGCFNQLLILKAQNPHLKTLISIGGWTWSTYFSDVALSPESRALFASSCVDFIIEYGFDGVDIDWEYPVSGGLPGNIYRPEDRENYTLLLAELRRQLDEAGDFLLTIAAPASPMVIENIEVELIHQYLDWINVMTYDFHGPWGSEADGVTNFNSPLQMASDDPLEEPYHSYFNLEAAIQTYLDFGVPPEKLQPGLPFYGRGFGNVANQNNGLYAGYAGPSPGTWENGVLDFWDLKENYINQNGYTSFWHEEAKVPWLFNPDSQIMISYDDTTSIAEKGDFINLLDLAGAMFWEFSGDRDGELLNTIYSKLIEPDHTSVSQLTTVDIDYQARLYYNYPNPFNPETTIHFDLQQASHITVAIYDISGNFVRTLLNCDKEAGYHSLSWDGKNDSGNEVASGIYFYHLDSGNFSETKSMLLLR